MPDPSAGARVLLFFCIVVAVVVAVAMHKLGWVGKQFKPPSADPSFALFAGFYVAAQIIERLMELVLPDLPVGRGTGTDKAAQAAQAKADRAKLALGVATVAGVVVANAFGLFFLKTIGIQARPLIDSICTGLIIASGTKPLHDFITLLQNRDSPSTSTKAELKTGGNAPPGRAG